METNVQKRTRQQTLQQRVLAKQKPDSKTQQASKPIRILPSRQASNHEACDCQRGRRQGRSLKICSISTLVYAKVDQLCQNDQLKFSARFEKTKNNSTLKMLKLGPHDCLGAFPEYWILYYFLSNGKLVTCAFRLSIRCFLEPAIL